MAPVDRRGRNYTGIRNGSTWKRINRSINPRVAVRRGAPRPLASDFRPPPPERLMLAEKKAAIDCRGVN